MHVKKVFVTRSLLGATSWNFMLISANNRLIEMCALAEKRLIAELLRIMMDAYVFFYTIVHL
jgi:hypothetical protein